MRLELQGVGHSYFRGAPQEVRALDGIDLVIEEGEFLGVIGPTGSGKSTLAQCLNGLLHPTDGRILAGGRDITGGDRKNLRWLRQRVGLVFQFPESQLFEETVEDDVGFGPRNLGLSRDETAARVERALELVGISDPGVARRSPFTLSGGQMRRVAIAGVLALDPEVLVLDEPAAGLDPAGRDEILGHVKALHEHRGLTVVLISHNMEEVARLADRLLVLAGGRAVMAGTPGEVFRRGPELRAMGLDVPATVQVLEALRHRGWTLPEVLLDVEATADAIASALQAGRGTGPC